MAKKNPNIIDYIPRFKIDLFVANRSIPIVDISYFGLEIARETGIYVFCVPVVPEVTFLFGDRDVINVRTVDVDIKGTVFIDSTRNSFECRLGQMIYNAQKHVYELTITFITHKIKIFNINKKTEEEENVSSFDFLDFER